MKRLAKCLVCFLALGVATTAAAQTKPAAQARHSQLVTTSPQLDVPADAAPAVAVVDRFGQALVASDFKTVQALLDTDVLILETGGAEHNREEYMGHHAISDAMFLKGTRTQVKQRRARLSGDLVWVATESELHASKDGKPMILLSTETMVLKRSGSDWRVVHIHWSSRPQTKAPAASADTSSNESPTEVIADEPMPTWLSAEDRNVLENGQGAGMAKAAEARGWPGPKHALELADDLKLDTDQRQRMRGLMSAMQASARAVGAQVIAAETALDVEIAKQAPNASSIAAMTEQVGLLRGQLRAVHLQTHLQAADLLTPTQRHRYHVLRGDAHHPGT